MDKRIPESSARKWTISGLLLALTSISTQASADFSNPEHAQLQPTRSLQSARCADGKDNDKDGFVDFPQDPGCMSRSDNSETNPKSSPYRAKNRPSLGTNASLHGARPFPRSNPWNQDVSMLPVDPNSDNLIASIGRDTGLHPDFGTVWNGAPNGIPYIIVKGKQRRLRVSFDYGAESDSGPYAIPRNAPIEGCPQSDGDRHVLILDRDNWLLYELYAARYSSGRWHVGSGAIYNLRSNTLRPEYWTSADAAGLPIFPGLVRYDEVVGQGQIRHALRFTCSQTRRAFVSPARHYASSDTDVNLPPMGMRVRLKAAYDISRFPSRVRIILTALKKYGMFVADNGSDWFISGAPDPRWNDDELRAIREVRGGDFEVIQMGEITTD